MTIEKRELLDVEEIRKILNFIHKGYKVPSIIYDTIYEVAKREIEEKERVVLIKRDPNIGKARIQAVYPKIIEGNSIEIYPASVVGFGADFDGDSIWGEVYLKIHNNVTSENKELTVHIHELKNTLYFRYQTKNNNITTYKVDPRYTVKVLAMNTSTGNIEYKEILEYSIHKNLNMYKLSDPKKRFNSFWVSSDHSLLAYNKELDKIVKITPEEIQENPSKYFLLKYTNGDR